MYLFLKKKICWYEVFLFLFTILRPSIFRLPLTPPFFNFIYSIALLLQPRYSRYAQSQNYLNLFSPILYLLRPHFHFCYTPLVCFILYFYLTIQYYAELSIILIDSLLSYK